MKIIWWILIAFWCGMIFFQSSKPATESHKQSLFIVVAVNHWVTALVGKEVVVLTDARIRMLAHFIEYMIFGILLFNGFSSGKSLRRTFLLFLAVGITWAVSDEIHQFFVPGRTMRLIDVMTDTAGILCGAGLMSCRRPWCSPWWPRSIRKSSR